MQFDFLNTNYSKMAIWILSLLYVGVALAHSGVKSIVIDGTT
jgi:hypothetical protein